MQSDLLHPCPDSQTQNHKLDRLVPAPNSYFMDIRCSGCRQATSVFSHAQSVIACGNCQRVLAKPTGGKCQIAQGNAYKVKNGN